MSKEESILGDTLHRYKNYKMPDSDEKNWNISNKEIEDIADQYKIDKVEFKKGIDIMKEAYDKELIRLKSEEPKSIYVTTGTNVGELVAKKNAAYGDSFNKCADFLKLLYPNGITTEQYTDMLCLIRMFDKMSRIATNKGAFDESPYRDIAGYSILGIVKDEQIKSPLIVDNSKLRAMVG